MDYKLKFIIWFSKNFFIDRWHYKREEVKFHLNLIKKMVNSKINHQNKKKRGKSWHYLINLIR